MPGNGLFAILHVPTASGPEYGLRRRHVPALIGVGADWGRVADGVSDRFDAPNIIAGIGAEFDFYSFGTLRLNAHRIVDHALGSVDRGAQRDADAHGERQILVSDPCRLRERPTEPFGERLSHPVGQGRLALEVSCEMNHLRNATRTYQQE